MSVDPMLGDEEVTVMYWNGMGGWGYLFMTVNSLLFWGLVVVGVLALVRHLGGSRQTGGRDAVVDPRQILAERYARGEIDDEEYHRRMDTLRHGGHTAANS